MITHPSQLLELQRVQVGALNAIGQALLAGAQKLSNLNVSASRGAINVATQAAQSLAGVRRPEEASSVSQAAAQQSVQTLVNYTRDWIGIVNAIGSDIGKVVEQQVSENNRNVAELLETAARNTGSQQAIAMMRNAISAGNVAFDTVSKATRQAADWTQASMTQAAKAATSAAADNAAATAKAAG